MTDVSVSIGFGGYESAQIIEVHPATIASFNSKITVEGSFSANQTVTVRFRLEFVDNVVSDAVEKSFTNSSSLWLSNDDFLHLYAYPNVIYAILVDAKLSPEMADAQVRIDLYGTTT